MKLAELIKQKNEVEASLKRQVQAGEYTMQYRPVVGPGPSDDARYWKNRGRGTLVQVRRLIDERRQLRQQVARTLAQHPEVVVLLAESTAARVRIKVFREVWATVESKGYTWKRTVQETALLKNSYRASRLVAECLADQNTFEWLLRYAALAGTTPPPPLVAWPNMRRKTLSTTLEFRTVKKLLRDALARQEVLEQRLADLCDQVEVED